MEANLTRFWENGKQPEGNIPCVAAKPAKDGLILLPANCEDESYFACVVGGWKKTFRSDVVSIYFLELKTF